MPDDGITVAADPVVIVGMAVEAPGGIDTAAGYWELLCHGREALGPFPTDRGWQIRELLAGSRRSGFKEIHDCGGFLTGATTFDPEFFGISPREAVAMDPQQRVALRVSWRALENSGINPDDVAGHDMGCYLGASATGYGPQMAEFSEYSGHLLAGTALSVISGRIAYTLGSMGPAVTIDASCASALVAFHAAVRGVQNGDCDAARRAIHPARSSRQRHQPRRPQRRPERAQRRGPSQFVPPSHRRGGCPSRPGRDGRRTRHRHQARGPYRVGVVGADVR